MRRKESYRGSGGTFISNSSILLTFVLLILSLSVVINNNNHVTTTTLAMAWTIQRSYNSILRRRNAYNWFPRSTPATTAAFIDPSKRIQRIRGGYCHRQLSTSSSASRTTSLYSYQEFLQQEEHEKIILSYFTDVEGDKFYLDRYVDNSKILTWTTTTSSSSSSTTTNTSTTTTDEKQQQQQDYDEYDYIFPYDRRIDFIDTNSMLVFGGDLWDKGGFDLYVTRQLLDLKRRYPDRVLWVIGNRDINKLRIPQELGLPSSSSKISVPYHPGLIWFQGSGRVGDPDGPLPPNEPGERLKWILGQTMGSPNAMENRRQELAWEANGFRNTITTLGDDDDDDDDDDESRIQISDLDVVQSYQESCHPKGEMGLFLSQALIVAPVGPILFVHGSLPLTDDVMEKAKEESKSVWDDLTFCMPWIVKTKQDPASIPAPASDYGVETIEDWFDAVNRFCSDNIEAWKNDIARLEQQPQNQDDNSDYKEQSKKSIWAYRAGYTGAYSDLVQYGMGKIPGGGKNPTVIYNSFTPEGMPQSFFLPKDEDEDNGDSIMSDVATCTREFFERSSIQLILTGHKPQGDMPSPIRIDDSSWVICADTSYSGDTMWFHHDDGHNSNKNTKVGDDDDDDDDDVIPENMVPGARRSNLGQGNSLSFRGDVAVSEVLVEISKGGTTLDSVRYHGVLSDGTEYESVNLLDADSHSQQNSTSSSSSCNTLGQVAPDFLVPTASDSPHEDGRWWTKGICSDGSHLYYAGEGYNVWNYIVSSTNENENENSNIGNNTGNDKNS